MLRDHRPFYLKKCDLKLRDWYVEYFLKPQFATLGPHYNFMKPWHVQVFGGPISLGRCANVISSPDLKVRLTIWAEDKTKGRIDIGDYCLICPGVRISAADSITIGDNCMIAGKAYITDADWHGIYDRVTTIGVTAPVVLENNVWIGDSAIVCKGVRIGENSIIGAGSIVTKDIPPNCVAAGNPACVVKQLDPDMHIKTRSEWFAYPDELAREHEELDRRMLQGNTLLGWLRSVFFPAAGD